MKDGESEFEVRFRVTPFLDVSKLEHRRFPAFSCNKKPVLTSFSVKEGLGMAKLRSDLVSSKLARRASKL